MKIEPHLSKHTRTRTALPTRFKKAFVVREFAENWLVMFTILQAFVLDIDISADRILFVLIIVLRFLVRKQYGIARFTFILLLFYSCLQPTHRVAMPYTS